MSYLEDKLCERQALIFEESHEEFSSPIFIRLFMLSRFAKEFDDLDYDPFLEAKDYVRLLSGEFPKMKEKKGVRYSKGELHWIGYIYRALSFHRKSSSKAIYGEISPSRLRELYNAYHTFDVDYALERIDELTLPSSNSDLAILKEVREKCGLYNPS